MSNRIKALGAALVGSVLMASSASAAIFVNSTTTPGTGDYAGKDIVRFWAGFDAANSPEALQGASGIQSLKITLTDAGTGPFSVGFTTPSGIPKKTTANVYGIGIDDPTARTATSSTDNNTFEAFGTAAVVRDPRGNGFSPQALAISNDGVTYTSIADPANGTTNPTATNTTLFGNLKGLRVEGFLQNPTTGPAFDASGKVAGFTNAPGQGSLIAVAVVPHGDLVTAVGQVAGDKGDTSGFAVASPEPGTFGVFTIGALGVLARRRRKA